MNAPRTEAELEARLSEPDDATHSALASLEGDIVVLGAGGKMGPSLVRMARRTLEGTPRRIIAVSRFSDATAAAALETLDVTLIRADLANPRAVTALPDAPNVLWLAGQKFGTSGDPVGTWTQNVVAPTHAAERYAGSRIVCFSTGNVYGRVTLPSDGSREADVLRPDGEYAASCIGRERVFQSVARRTGSPLLLYRLFYANDLRYGVITEIARKVLLGEPVALDTGHVNVIWQGDANRLALRALGATSIDAERQPLNVTGPVVRVRTIAECVARHAGVTATFSGAEGTEALIGDVTALTQRLPYQGLPLETLCAWAVRWIREGGRLLSRPTKFEVRDGRF